MTQQIYRAWINQPSGQQPLHHLHGVTCIAVDNDEPTVQLFFTQGPMHSMVAPRECIDQIKLSAA